MEKGLIEGELVEGIIYMTLDEFLEKFPDDDRFYVEGLA